MWTYIRRIQITRPLILFNRRVYEAVCKMRSRRALFGLGVIAVAAVVTYVVQVRRTSPLPYVPETALDLGTIRMTRAFSYTIPIHNAGDRDLVLSDIRASCGCASIVSTSPTIPAHGSFDLPVTLNLMPPTLSEAAKAEREVEIKFVPIVEPQRPLTLWTLRARVLQPYWAEPRVLDFSGATAVIQGDTEPAGIVEGRCHQPLSRLVATGDCGSCSVIANAAAPVGTSYSIRFVPLVGRGVGPFNGTITIRGYDRDDAPLTDLEIPVSGEIQPDISHHPSSLTLGRSVIGRTITSDLVLQSRLPFTIIAVTTRGSAAEIGGTTRAAAPIHTLSVATKIEAAGDRRGEIVVDVRRASGVVSQVCVPLAYYGTSEE